MFNKIATFKSQNLRKTLCVSLFLTSSIVGFGPLGEPIQPALSSQKVNTTMAANLTTAATTNREFPKKDGIYLYGQSLEPNQLGQGYIVFEKQQNKVVGALYMPYSEFSCFQGTVHESGELAMTVTSSPAEVGVIEVSTTSSIPKISDDDSFTYAYSVALQNYHQLNSVSANDRKILQMCNQSLDSSYTKFVK